jgi:hypothetical protein
MVWLTTLILTVTTGEALEGEHSAVVSRENIQMQGINFLPTLSSSYNNGIVTVMPTVAPLHVLHSIYTRSD